MFELSFDRERQSAGQRDVWRIRVGGETYYAVDVQIFAPVRLEFDPHANPAGRVVVQHGEMVLRGGVCTIHSNGEGR